MGRSALEKSDRYGISLSNHSPESSRIYVEAEANRFSQAEVVSDSKETMISIFNRADHI